MQFEDPIGTLKMLPSRHGYTYRYRYNFIDIDIIINMDIDRCG